MTPLIVSHRVIEILEALPPTKVSSIAFSTKNKITPLYAAYTENSNDIRDEIINENFGEILNLKFIKFFKVYLFEKFFKLLKSAFISPFAPCIIELNSSFWVLAKLKPSIIKSLIRGLSGFFV